MPHDPKRIEAAARELRALIAALTNTWISNVEAKELAPRILDAAYPELSSDPPSAWLAPWEPTGAMLQAGRDALRFSDPEHTCFGDHVAQILRAMRDAHTKEQT